ncbi:MAG: lipocalin family protein [Chitinophagales bacterium]|nr:lipocalin family protein [Chitinophagales bacterium]
MRFFIVFVLLLSICACNSTNKKIVGYWKMEEVSINGATLPFEQIGKPFYSFDEKGNYSLEMNSQLEKGTYSIEEATITLVTSDNHKPKQEFHFETCDSTELHFVSTSIKNKMTVKLKKQNNNSPASI